MARKGWSGSPRHTETTGPGRRGGPIVPAIPRPVMRPPVVTGIKRPAPKIPPVRLPTGPNGTL